MSGPPVADPKRLYLDQMLAVDVAASLKSAGHDAVRASECGQARADDRQILEFAIDQNRILITLDEHFGDWVVLPLRHHPGVVRLKVHPTTSRNVIDLLVPFLERHSADDFVDNLVILSATREKWVRTG